MSKSQVKKVLQSMEKEDVISFFLELYDAKKEAKEYIEYIINPNEEEQFEKAKKIIENEYYPSKGEPKERLSVAKKAISDFSVLKPSPVLKAELLIFLVECGCQYTYDYGDMNESFYTAMENNFRRALEFMKDTDLLERFRENAESCVEWSSVCGYGFADDIKSLFAEYYEAD
jgi:hypothetical protein